MPEKLDLARADKAYYAAQPKPELVEFGPIPHLTIEGRGEPAGEAFLEATQALYPLAYGVKKVLEGEGRDFAVPSLEGLWWVEGDGPALEVPRARWSWKLLIRMPDFVTADAVAVAKAEVARKGEKEVLDRVRLETIAEGRCVQMLHVGPYATEPAPIETLFHFIGTKGLVVDGLHHEIDLSDPRRAQPEKVKTIIRYPVR